MDRGEAMTNEHVDTRADDKQDLHETRVAPGQGRGLGSHLGKALAWVWKRASAILTVAAIIGAFLMGLQNGGRDCDCVQEHRQHGVAEESVTQSYTCTMHPQVKQELPGTCPVCGMVLVSLSGTERPGNLPKSGRQSSQVRWLR